MDEHHAVVGIHRAIDLAVEADEALVRAAATMFPAYDVGGAGWSTAFARMLIDHGVVESVDDVYPDLTRALERLAEAGPVTTWHSVRRLQVLAGLVRVSPAHAPDGESAELVERALRHHTGSQGDPAALHHKLLDPEVLNHAGWREQVPRLVADEALA